MSNAFGVTPPTIFYGLKSWPIPKTPRGKRDEDFVRITKNWTSPSLTFQERIKGYRFQASYEWNRLDQSDFDAIAEIYNYTGAVFVQLSVFPFRYQVHVKKEKKLADGLSFADGAKLELVGTRVMKSYPRFDQIYTFIDPNDGLLVVTKIN